MDVRYNNLLIDRFDESDGIMHVTAFARVPGVLTYRRSDGSTRNELVAPEFLKAFDSQGRPLAAKLAGIPVVNEHPAEGLIRHNEDAIARLRVGDTSNKVKVWTDGKIEVSFDVFDSQTQQDIRTGRKTGVSLGYRVNAVPQQGVWQDSEAQIRYDAVQSEPFEADHLAVCANPRAANARITRFDSAIADGWAYQIDSSTTHEDAPMARQIVVGDEVFSVGDEALAGRLLALIQENRSLQQQNTSLTDYIEAMEEEEDESEEYGEEEESSPAIGYWDAAAEESGEEYTDAEGDRLDKGPGCPGPGDCSKSGGKARYKNSKQGNAKAKSEAAALGGLGKEDLKSARANRIQELRVKAARSGSDLPAAKSAETKYRKQLNREMEGGQDPREAYREKQQRKADKRKQLGPGYKKLSNKELDDLLSFDSTDLRELLDSLRDRLDKGPGCPGPGDCSKSGGKAKYKNTKAGNAKAKSEAAALGNLGKAGSAKAGSRLEELRGKYGKSASEQANAVLAKRQSQMGTLANGKAAINTAHSALNRSEIESNTRQARSRAEMAAKVQSKAAQPKGGSYNYGPRKKSRKSSNSLSGMLDKAAAAQNTPKPKGAKKKSRSSESLADLLDKAAQQNRDSTDLRELLDSIKEAYDMKTTKKKPPMPPEDEMDMEDEEYTDAEANQDAFDADDDADDLAADALELAEVQQKHIDALEAELAIATRILESRRTDEDDEGDEDYTDSDDRIDSIVQERVADIMATYQDAAPYLDSDFKFDGVASKYDVMRAAIARIDSEFPGESDIDLEEATDSQIETMYRAAKRYVPRHRVDGVSMLSRAIDRVTKTPPNMDAIEIRQQRMDEDFARGRRPLNSSRK